jgi:hypothetical protein
LNVAAAGLLAYTATPFESNKSTTEQLMLVNASCVAVANTENDTCAIVSGAVAVTGRDFGSAGVAVITCW